MKASRSTKTHLTGGARATPDGEENDRIGRLGEIEFHRICTRAKLHCSKVEPDRTGKDFIVEFPLAALKLGETFEGRNAPLQFAVQVKTISQRTRSASLALSVAERLAKDLRPTIVCVLRIDEDDQFKSMNLIHVLDGTLGKVLAALRRATISEQPLNKLSVSLATDRTSKVDLEAAALYARLASLVPKSMEQYALEKTGQLSSLGYPEDGTRGVIRVGPVTVAELTDGLLGLSPLRNVELEVTETRFNIELPVQPSMTAASMTITPAPPREVVVSLHSTSRAEELRMKAGLTLPPLELFQSGGRKMVVSWPLGHLVLSDGAGVFHFAAEVQVDGRLSVSEWLTGLNAANMIMGGATDLSISTIGGDALLSGRIEVPQEEPQHVAIIAVLERLGRIRAQAGAADEPIGLKTLASQATTIGQVEALLQGENEMTFDLETDSDLLPSDEEEGLFLTAVRVGENQVLGLAIPVIFQFQRSDGRIRCTGYILPKRGIVDELGNFSEATYERFIASKSKLSGRRLRIVGQFSSIAPQLLQTEPTAADAS